MKLTPCRYCGKPIIWCLDAEGKRIPVDVSCVFYFVIGSNRDPLLAQRIPDDEYSKVGVNHFQTCPKAAEVKKDQKKGAKP